MPTQHEKAQAFVALHRRPRAFVIPNPWDAGSARVLGGLGFEALATTSSGFAAAAGMLDGQPGLDAVLEHAAALVAASELPISADLESGFGDAPERVAETIRRAAGVGLVGGSIEDYTGEQGDPLYAIELAAERVRAAAEAAHSLAFPFTLTARAENFIRGRPDLADTVARLQAYQEAGADVLYAPGLRSPDDIASVVREIDRPLNVLAWPGGPSVAELEALGVRRISVGGMLSAIAYGALIRAGRQIQDAGTFDLVEEASLRKDLQSLLTR